MINGSTSGGGDIIVGIRCFRKRAIIKFHIITVHIIAFKLHCFISRFTPCQSYSVAGSIKLSVKSFRNSVDRHHHPFKCQTGEVQIRFVWCGNTMYTYIVTPRLVDYKFRFISRIGIRNINGSVKHPCLIGGLHSGSHSQGYGFRIVTR